MDDQIVLVMTVEVRPGVNGLINIHYDDDSREIAQEFGLHYSLHPDLVQSLTSLVAQNKSEAISKLHNQE